MGKPRMIILIRHAQSEGNKNREIHQYIPDHRVKLTPDGLEQAEEAGRRLRSLLKPTDTIRIYTSPYRRTRETTEGILRTLTSDHPEPTPFPRESITVYEEPRLREQDFGNFQPCSAEMERMWQERADYGHFFYRIPNGESAADAYDRVSGFNESLWRSISEDDFPSVCVLVTHGLMTRVFLMKWYHWSVEHFEDLRNVNHCEFIVMNKNIESGKYFLENELRTWSDLKRRAVALNTANPSTSTSNSASPNGLNGHRIQPVTPQSPVVQRRWGGCAFGCNHDQINFERKVRRRDTSDLLQGSGTANNGRKNASQVEWVRMDERRRDEHYEENGLLTVNEDPSSLPRPSTTAGDGTANATAITTIIREEPVEPPATATASPFDDLGAKRYENDGNADLNQNDGEKAKSSLYSMYSSSDNNLHHEEIYLTTSNTYRRGRDGGGTLSGAPSPTMASPVEGDFVVPAPTNGKRQSKRANSL